MFVASVDHPSASCLSVLMRIGTARSCPIVEWTRFVNLVSGFERGGSNVPRGLPVASGIKTRPAQVVR